VILVAKKRLVAVEDIVKLAEHAHEQWSLAMVGADDTRKVNEVFKKQYLCKVVKAVAEGCPTVDAVEVARCKDCVYLWRPEENRMICGILGGMGEITEESYCSKGMTEAQWMELHGHELEEGDV